MLIVCADRKLIPMPAITACLIVSVLVISIAMFRFGRRPAKPSSIEFHVSEPFSRTMNGSSASASAGCPPVPTSG